MGGALGPAIVTGALGNGLAERDFDAELIQCPNQTQGDGGQAGTDASGGNEKGVLHSGYPTPDDR
jgi:hypothetical protein